MAAVRAYHYLNGSLDAEDNSVDNANPHLAWNQLVILSDFAGGNMWGSGAISEFRILNVSLSPEWIAAEYLNQNDPSSFYSIGPEITLEADYQPDIQSTNFQYMKNFVVDHTKIGTDLTDFPMLIDIFDADLRTDVQPDGDDILFKSGNIWCPHEITFFDQSYNSTHAHLIAWVRTDLSSSIDTTITMYYGNPDLTFQEVPHSVWDTSFGAVWHLNEDPAGTIYDSTANGNDATGLPISSEPTLQTGKISGCSELYGEATNDRIEAPHSSSLVLQSDMTVEAWIRTSNTDPTSDVIVAKWSDVGHRNYWLGKFDGSTLAFFIDNTQNVTTSLSLVNDGDWHHVVGVASAGSGQLLLYVDGVERASAPYSGSTQTGTSVIQIGNNPGSVGFIQEWDGRIDEVRILNNDRSAEWIATEYRNQYDPSSFYSIGAEEEISGKGCIITTNSESSVTIGLNLSLEIQTSTWSYANDFTLGTSFSIENGSLPIWTANVLVSPPPEVDAVSFEITYPKGDWWPFSVKTPSGLEKTFSSDWTCFDGKLIVAQSAVDEYGMWKIQFLDRNHVLDMQMGPTGGPYSTTDQFTIGEDIQFRSWSSGTTGSTIALQLTDPTGSTWYTGSTTFQGEKFTLPYYHRKHLTISHTSVDEDLVNFPVLVNIYDADLRTDVRPDGRDIAFAIGEETLSHEIELFDQTFNLTHAHLVAWVKVPLLSGSSDTVISMYYDNPLAPIVFASGPVWDSDYVGVWHLGESGSGVVDEYADSSLYNNHGQGGNGNVSYIPSRVTTQIGYGQDFTNHFIDCGNATSLDITGNQITLQLWMQFPSATHPNMGPFNHKGWYNGYRFTMSANSQKMNLNLGLKPNPPGGTYNLGTSQNIAPGEWHHVVATLDGSLMRFYIDGSYDVPVTLQDAIKTDSILSALPYPFRIGHGDHPEAKAWTFPWIGQIDEVRISDVARSGAWIQTEFQNQNNPSSFYSVSAEESIGYSESASINLDTSVPAGVWYATARYSDGNTDVNHRTGIFTRSFIVKRGTSLSLTAPGDAVADGITTKLVGEQLYVEFELGDALDATLINGATVSMNWSVSGVPTDVQLNDYGDGRYGKTLNTSDLDTYGRWRIDLEASHPFYNNATDFFYLDLSHRTFLTYEPPPDVPYGDNFEIRLTLKDRFDSTPLSGATISCNATILGLPTDYGNGTYLVTVDSTGFSTGEHTIRFTATPSTSYLFSSNIDVQFNYRPVATESTLLSSDNVEAPWGQQTNTSLFWYDTDHAGVGLEGGVLSISPFVQTQTFEEGSGFYNITIDVSSLTPGTYFFNLTLSKLNYQSSMTTISVTILPHRTSLSVDYNSTIPVGTDAYFDVSWLDLNLDSIGIGSGNLSQVMLDWGTGSDIFFGFGFWLDSSSWAVGSYSINVSLSATDSPRFYTDSYIVVQFEIRKLHVYLSWDPLEPFPNGNDFVMFVHVNVSEPGSPIDGTPIAGLNQTYFSATNETGGSYLFKSFANLGAG
ncbi:MAG: LamG-like jellyroll fold domain-containing protein, partial [Candidatus Thorarchaeota archaeon]